MWGLPTSREERQGCGRLLSPVAIRGEGAGRRMRGGAYFAERSAFILTIVRQSQIRRPYSKHASIGFTSQNLGAAPHCPAARSSFEKPSNWLFVRCADHSSTCPYRDGEKEAVIDGFANRQRSRMSSNIAAGQKPGADNKKPANLAVRGLRPGSDIADDQPFSLVLHRL